MGVFAEFGWLSSQGGGQTRVKGRWEGRGLAAKVGGMLPLRSRQTGAALETGEYGVRFLLQELNAHRK